MSVPADDIEAYRKSLQEELTYNSKPIISMLTMLAEDMLNGDVNGAAKVAEIILDQIYAVDVNRKLPFLYLIDSICKNIGDPYTKIFEKDIVSIFKHVFEHGDEAIRAALYKLRKTWIALFSTSVLHSIDTVAHAIDPAWPDDINSFVAPPSSSSKRPKKNSDPTSASSVTKTVQRKITAIDSLHSEKHSPSTSSSIATLGNRKSVVKPVPASSTLKRKIITNEAPSSSKIPPKSISTFGNQDRDYRKEYAGAHGRQEHPEFIQRMNKAKGNQPEIGATVSSLPVKKRAAGSIATPPQNMAPNQLQVPAQAIGPVTPQVPLQPLAPILSPLVQNVSVSPNVAIMPNAPRQPVTISSFASSLSHQPPTRMSPESIPQLSKDSNQQYVQVDGKTVKLFFIDENTSIVLMKADSKLSFNELVKKNPYDLEPKLIMFEGKPTKVYIDRERNGGTDFVTLNFNSPVHTFFEGVHAQRIKAGGPCREIIFNDVPYQASFGERAGEVGPPIEVKFIGDNQQTHTLNLEGPPPRVKLSDEIEVDLWSAYVQKVTGQPGEYSLPAGQISNSSLTSSAQQPYPPQSIIGSPSPSILLPPNMSLVNPTLNTTGLAPGLVTNQPVTISTSAVALTAASPLNTHQAALPPNATLPVQNPIPNLPNMVSGPTDPSSSRLDDLPYLDNLFDKLKSVGLLGSVNTTTASSTTSIGPSSVTAPPSVKLSSTKGPSVTSTSTSTTLAASASTSASASTVTRTGSPSSSQNGLNSLDEIETEPLVLETKSLKAEHPKVIADLINGTQCFNCSLRFEVGDSGDVGERSKYSVHLDWHFRLNQRERTDSKSKSVAVRKWFCPLDLWVTHKEITDETDESIKDADHENSDSSGEKKLCTVSANGDENLNECDVCKEKFETVWNEDEEEWQLLNAMKGQDEKIYHPLCLEDLEKQKAAEIAAAAAAAAAAVAAEEQEKEKAKNNEKDKDDNDKDITKEDKDVEMKDGEDENNGDKTKEEETKTEEEENVNNKENNGDQKNVRGRKMFNNVDGDEDDNDNDEDNFDLTIDDDYTLYPAVTKGHIEVSVCTIC